MTKGQVLITFDDGLAIHDAAAETLSGLGLHGTFGIITSLIGTPGFLNIYQLGDISLQHFICNHSHTHPWSGVGAAKAGIVPAKDVNELTADYIKARDILNEQGFHGDYLLMPFGTHNVGGESHLRELVKEFTWMRLTIGSPLPEEFDLWQTEGYKRLYPMGYRGPIVGITEAADVRRPGGVREVVDNAVAAGSLAVLVYHDVANPVGEGQNITWKRFVSDMEYIAGLDGLECVTPDMAAKGGTS